LINFQILKELEIDFTKSTQTWPWNVIEMDPSVNFMIYK